MKFHKSASEDSAWRRHTAINPFGSHSKNGYQNDIGYNMLGSEDYVYEVQLKLNIKNPEEKGEALNHLAIFAQQTLVKLDIETPANLIPQIKKDKQFYFESDSYYLCIKRVKRQ